MMNANNLNDLTFKTKLELKFYCTLSLFSIFIFLYFLFFDHDIIPSIAFLMTIVFSISIGQAILVNFKSLKPIPSSVRFGLSIGIGMIVSFLWAYFLSPYTIEPWTYSILLIISLLILVLNYFNYKSKLNLNQNKSNIQIYNFKFNQHYLDDSQISKLFEIVTFGIIISAIIVSFLKMDSWPPWGDIARHSTWTAFLIHEGNFISHVPSMPDRLLTYPLGIHFFAGNLSILYNLAPAQIFFILGNIGMLVIFITIFSFTSYITKSKWIPIIIASSTLYVSHSSEVFTELLWALNGLIPLLWGLSTMFLLISFLFMVPNLKNFKNISLIFLIIFTGILMYPPTTIYLLVILTAFILTPHKFNSKTQLFSVSNIKKSFFHLDFYIFFIIILGLSTGFIFEIPLNNINLLGHTYIDTQVNPSHHPIFSPAKMFTEPFFILSTILGISCAIFDIILLKKFRFLSIFVLFFIGVILNGDLLTGIFGLILAPARFVVVIPIFSWILLGLVVYSLFPTNYSIKKIMSLSSILNDHSQVETVSPLFHKIITKKIFEFKYTKYFVFILFLLLTLILIPNLIGEKYPQTTEREIASKFLDLSLFEFQLDTSKYGYMEPYMDGFKWIDKNISSNQIIFDAWQINNTESRLTPPAYRWLPGVSFQQLVNWDSAHNRQLTAEESKELVYSFAAFGRNIEFLYDMEKYGVTYILIRPPYDFPSNVFLDSLFTLEYSDSNTMIYKLISKEGNDPDRGNLFLNRGLDKFDGTTFGSSETDFLLAGFLDRDLVQQIAIFKMLFYLDELDDDKIMDELRMLKKNTYNTFYPNLQSPYILGSGTIESNLLKIGDSLNQIGDTNEALELYHYLYSLDETEITYILKIAEAYELKKDFYMASSYYFLALKLSPTDDILLQKVQSFK